MGRVDQQQPPRGQPPDVEAHARVDDPRGHAGGPGDAAVRRQALPEHAVTAADEHPHHPVAQLDHHVLQRPMRCLDAAVEPPRGSRIRRDRHALKLSPGGEPSLRRLLSPRHRQEPGAVRQHQRLVQPEGKGHLQINVLGRRPGERRPLACLRDDRPDREVARSQIALIVEEPQPPRRIVPQARIVDPRSAGHHHHLPRLGPRHAVVVARRQQDHVAGIRLLRSARVEARPQPTVRRSFDGRNPLPRPRPFGRDHRLSHPHTSTETDANAAASRRWAARPAA